MSTKDKELQEAISELCHATIKILKLTNGDIPEELRQYGVLSKIKEIIGLMEEQGESTVSGQTPAAETEPLKPRTVPEHPVLKEDVQERYAYRTSVGDDGAYCWDFTVDSIEGNAFKLYIHSDDSVEFEVLTMKLTDMPNEWELERETYNPAVVTIDGDPSGQATLKGTARGTGTYDRVLGRVTIVEPCKAEFVL